MNLNNDAKTYLDIFKEHYPNFIFKEFYGNYCPAGFFKYGMDMHHPDCSADCDKCWSCTADSEWCESDDYEIPEYWKGISAPAQTEAAVPTDKYAEAVQLNAQIMTSAKAAQQNLYDMAMGFKKMRDDKLYKELGYDNFGDYCESETGMKRRSVYGYISVVENLPSDFVQSTAQIGKEKLYLLSTLDEEHRAEIIENTDLESTTVKELREQIEQLKQSEAKSKAEYEEIFNENNANSRKLSEYLNKNIALERQLKELESQPRDVAVQADPEQERKFSETLRRLNLDFENYREEADRDLADMRNQRNAALDRAEAAEARLSTPKAESNIKPFLIKMTMDDFSALINALENEPYLKEIIQKAQVIRL